MASEEVPFGSIVEAQMRELQAAAGRLAETLDTVRLMAETVVAALRAGNKILCAGNGGSAADALHMAEELVGRYRTNRVSLPAISLTADATALTCIGNDYGFDKIFSRQVEGLGRGGDVLVLFSTSGNSANLLEAAREAKGKGILVLAFLGKDGGKLAPLADIAWIAPGGSPRVQELHTWAMHSILECVEVAFPAAA
ncbi:MAG: SIS domain-containing protein [Verrucomicrobium sp.]|nr:SIS domain-containing protein [Verrucomicrobium sp.]